MLTLVLDMLSLVMVLDTCFPWFLTHVNSGSTLILSPSVAPLLMMSLDVLLEAADVLEKQKVGE